MESHVQETKVFEDTLGVFLPPDLPKKHKTQLLPSRPSQLTKEGLKWVLGNNEAIEQTTDISR